MLRSPAPLFAGPKPYARAPTALADATGEVVCTGVYGSGFCAFSKAIDPLGRPAVWVVLSAAILLAVIGFLLLRHHADALEAQAERALAAPLLPPV